MTDCVHDWRTPGKSLDAVFVIDDWQGPTDLVVQCRECRAYALLRLLHWSGRNLTTRIFAVAGLDTQAMGIFLRNMRSDYCDLSRHGAETAMLMATASPLSCGVILRVPELIVLASLDVMELGEPSLRSWRDQAPDEKNAAWLAVLQHHGIDTER